MPDLSKRLDALIDREVPERRQTMQRRLREVRELLKEAEFNVGHWLTFQVMLQELRSVWILPDAFLGSSPGTWTFVRRGTVHSDSPDRFRDIRGLWVTEFAVPADAVGRYGIGISPDQMSMPPAEGLDEVEHEPCRQCQRSSPLVARFNKKTHCGSGFHWEAEICRLCLECVLLDYVGSSVLSWNRPFTVNGKVRPSYVEHAASKRSSEDTMSLDEDDDADD